MRFIIPLIFGLAGAAVLIGLGVWQVQRLTWKEALLAQIEARADGPSAPLPTEPSPSAHAFLPVAVSGVVAGGPFNVFGTWRGAGAGVRLVIPFQTEGRGILVDLGVTPWAPGTAVEDAARVAPPKGTPLSIAGHLSWPEGEACSGEPDPGMNDWCGRDIDAFARISRTEPVLLVAAEISPAQPAITPLPISIEGIPNNHLGYAIQWFGLALVWLGMTAFFLWRMRRRTE